MVDANITVISVADTPWGDAQQVFGTRGDPSSCWCQFFKLSNAEFHESTSESCSALLRGQVERNDPAPGLIAYLDGEPVGWVAVEPRTSFPTALRGNVVKRGSTEPADDANVWAIICFVVRVGFRRRGISRALVSAATDWARDHGARVIEGYPVDTEARKNTSSSELFHGTVTLFESAGFTVATRPTPGRALMRREF